MELPFLNLDLCRKASIMVGQILNEQICIYIFGQETVYSCFPSKNTGIIVGQLYSLLKWHLSFSERGAKDKGTASGVGGIMRRDQVTEEGSRTRFSVGRGSSIPGVW